MADVLCRSKALIIYDEAESGQAWGFSLQQIGIEPVLVSQGEDIVGRWAEELPDLILLEDFDPGSEELELCRRLRPETPVPILLLTGKTGERFLLDAYRAGVDEAITLPVSPALFLAKVRAWLRHTQALPAAAVGQVQTGGFSLDPVRRRLVTPDGRSLRLTNLEARLLFILMAHLGRALESSLLVERIWGAYGEGDNIMLKNVVYRLRRKLEVDPARPCYLLNEPGFGYKFVP